MRLSYRDRLQRLLRTLEISKEIFSSTDLTSTDEKKFYLIFIEQTKELLLNPEPQHKNSKSLEFVENDILTYWNEGTGSHIEIFWERLNKESIGFKRVDIIKEVLKRRKIKNIHEYDHIIDSVVVAQQTGRMSNAEAEKMYSYIQEFESRQKR